MHGGAVGCAGHFKARFPETALKTGLQPEFHKFGSSPGMIKMKVKWNLLFE